MPHKEPFQYPDMPYQCMDCGEILQGPHTGEYNTEHRQTDEYKGTRYSNALCDDCDAKRHRAHVIRKIYKKGLLGR